MLASCNACCAGMDVNEFTARLRDAGLHIDAVALTHYWPAKLALAFGHWPMWLTAPVYHMGQGLMCLPGPRNLADCRAVYALRHGDGA